MLGIRSERTKAISKHISRSVFFKAGSILCNFLLVPLTIDFLNTSNYGVWLLISSFVSWFAFFDIGLGHGLRNKFAEAKAGGDESLIRTYVSSTYVIMAAIAAGMIGVFLLVAPFVNWSTVFNASGEMNTELGLLMLVVFSTFSTQLILKLITSIYTADQQPSKQDMINFLIQLTSVLAIVLVTRFFSSSLLLFGTVFSFIPVTILLLFNLTSFTGHYKAYQPNIRLFERRYARQLLGLGMRFFIIQMAGVIVYSTDNMIITQLYGPAEVVPYNIAFKYLSIITIGYSIIVTPYWSAITEAYVKEEFEWIRRSMRNLNRIALLFMVLTVVFVFGSDIFYQFWIGDYIRIPKLLSALMGLYVIIQVFQTPFLYFINGTGKVKLQLVALVSAALINIPLSILFAKYLQLGSAGVILATALCLMPVLILARIQYHRIINKTAKGIWNE